MPCSPERVWRAIQAAQGTDTGTGGGERAARQNLASQGNSPQGIGEVPQDGATA